MATVTVIQPITATETNKLRVAAYCRVSSSSEEQLNSYQAQLTYYSHKFEDSETEELVDLYADEGIIGTCEDKRDEFQRLMKDCRRGKVDRIYTKSISRFARNTRDCLKNIRELKSLGITIFFEKEGIDTANVTDEMMITIMGGLAQEESVSISQNMRWSIRKRMENGTMKMSSAPFGYRQHNGELIVHGEEEIIVKQIFDWYLHGCGISLIALRLNTMGVQKFGRDCHWTPSTVSNLLKNEKYIGDQLFQKQYTTDTLPFRRLENRGELQQYYYIDRNEPIVSRKDFASVQLLLEQNKEYGLHESHCHYLAKHIYCSECGATFKRKRRRDSFCWVCRRHDSESHLCSAVPVDEKVVESAFIAMHNKLLQHHKEILLPLQSALQELKLRKFSGNLRVMDIHKEIAKMREQIHVLSRLKTKGFLDEAKYQEQTTDLNAKINRLHQELNRMTRFDEEDETLDQIEMLTELFEKREHLMTEFEPDVFESIVDRIVVKSRNVLEFHLIGGLKLTEKI